MLSMDITDEDRFFKVMNMSLSDAISKKKLYMVDYTSILRNLICKNGMVRFFKVISVCITKT